MLVGLLTAPTITHATICTAPDDGTGTAQMPPNCSQGYLSPDQVHMIINGLPPGTHIDVDATHSKFGLFSSGPGGSLGGETEQFNSSLFMQLTPSSGLPPLIQPTKSMFVQCQTDIAPRVRGTPVQSFNTEMIMLQGQILGDPDFDLLRIVAGTGFGMPSPGHTTLTRLPGGNWAVDSFFDVFCRIDFIGHSPGPYGGMSGSTTATIRMRTGEPATPIYCRCKGDSDGNGTVDVGIDLPWFANQLLLGDDADLCADINGDLVVNGLDIKPYIPLVISGGNCPALDAWETPSSDGTVANSSRYDFGGPGQPPIPAGFFGPGSDPFNGQVLLEGQPLDQSIFPTDTVVRRPSLPPPPATVPIELAELSLVSVNPITITTGGVNPEPWLVNTAISDTLAPGGLMNVQQTTGLGGTFTANLQVRPVFAFTNMNDLAAVDAGTLNPDQVRCLIIDTGDPGSPTNPLQISFQGTSSSPWVFQPCPQVLQDGLFFFHNPGTPFIPGVQAQTPSQCFKPGPMKHVSPGEAHYIQPPNKRPGVQRCGYNWIASHVFCRAGKVGKCPPAPAILCTKICPQPIPCPQFVVRIVRIGCKNAAGTYNRGWCFQFYRLRLPPFDCAVCP